MASKKSSSPAASLLQPWLDEVDPGVLSRGEKYYRSGVVAPAATQRKGHQSFVVQGSEPYFVHLHDSDLYRNSCTCPHAESVNICKHMVAAKLYALGPPPAEARPSANHSENNKVSAKVQEIQANIAFLRARSAEELCNWIGLQCDSNPQLAQQLSRWRNQSQDVPQTPAQWRRYLTQAMPQRRDMWGRELQRWVNDALESLELLRQQVTQQPAHIRYAAEVALRRLFKIWESCDDSNGEGQELYAALQELLKASIHEEAPPASWLGDWLQLMEDDPLGHWDEAGLLAVAGESLRQAFARKACEEWQAIASKPQTRPRNQGTNAAWHFRFQQNMQRRQWRRRYLWSVQQEQSTEAWLHVMQKTADDELEWIELVAACEQHQQPRLALQYAQQGLSLFKGSDRLQQQLLQCYRRDGWDQEAYELAKTCLNANPTEVQRLDALLDCAKAIGISRDQQFKDLWQNAIATARPPYGAQAGKDIHIALLWLLHEDQWEQALDLLDQPGMVCSEELLIKQLARRLPDTHQKQAADLLQALLFKNMERAKSPYSAELQLVKQIRARLPAEDRSTWLQSLRKIYLRKSNFIHGLDQMMAAQDS